MEGGGEGGMERWREGKDKKWHRSMAVDVSAAHMRRRAPRRRELRLSPPSLPPSFPRFLLRKYIPSNHSPVPPLPPSRPPSRPSRGTYMGVKNLFPITIFLLRIGLSSGRSSSLLAPSPSFLPSGAGMDAAEATAALHRPVMLAARLLPVNSRAAPYHHERQPGTGREKRVRERTPVGTAGPTRGG
jgi:hypothetical protein